MADYKIRLGVELDTKNIDTAINKYQGKPIEVKSKLDTSGIDKKIAGYRVKKPIEVNAKLNTSGLAKKIGDYKPKTPVKLNAKLDTKNIDTAIKGYKAKKDVEINVRLNHKGISEQLRNYKPKAPIKVDVKLDSNDINKQIRAYQTRSSIKLGVKLTTKDIDDKIRNYKAKTPIKLDVKINKNVINEQIKNFNPRNTIRLKAALQKGAIAEEIRKYKPSAPIKVDLELDYSDIDKKVGEYVARGAVELPVKLKPASKGFSDSITKKPIRVNAELNPEDIQSINSQLVAIQPETPIIVKAQLDDKAIDSAIAEYQAKAPIIKINVDVNDNDIDKEAKKHSAHTPIEVNVRLNREKLNEQIKSFKTKTPIKVDVKLVTKGIAEQIKKIKLKTPIKLDVKINNIELNKDDINNQIHIFTPDTPIKLGVKLDMDDAKAEIENLRTDLQKFGKIVVQLPNSNVGAGRTNIGSDSGSRSVSSNNIASQFREIDFVVDTTGDHLDNFKKGLSEIGVADGSIDEIVRDFERLEISIKKVTSRLDENNNLTLTVKGVDQNGRSVTAMRKLDQSGKPIKYGTTISQDFKETENAFKRLKALGKEIGKLDIKISGLDANENRQEIEVLTTSLNRLKTEFNELFDITEKNLDLKQISELLQDIEKAGDRVEAIKAKVADRAASQKRREDDAKMAKAEEIQYKLDTKDFDEDISRIETKMKSLGSVSDDLANNFIELKSYGGQMATALSDGDIDGAIKAYEEYLRVLETINNELKINGNNQKSVDVDFGRLKELGSEIDSIKKKIETLDPKVNMQQLNMLSTTLEELEAEYNNLRSALDGKLSSSQLDELGADAARAKRELEELKAKIADTKKALASKIETKLADGTIKKEVNDVASKFNMVKDKSIELRIAMGEVDSAVERMNSSFKSGNIDGGIKAYQEYERALKSVKNQLDINIKAEKEAASYQKLTDDIAAFQSKIDAWLTKNSAAADRFGAKLLELRAQADSCDRATLDHLERELKQIDKEAEAAGLKMQKLSDRLRAQWQKYSAYLGVSSIFMYAEQALRDMFEQVKLIDSAMTELKKVTNETDESYGRFLKNAASRAKEIGTTIDGLVASTADFARLGYGFEDSQELAEVANIYAVVGDEIDGVEDATQSLVSTLAAFKEEMNDMSDSDFAMSIVDKMNEVSNNFAISSGGIGEALQRSASSMAAANNTLDETIAMITAANEVAQNPEKVGNAMKTMSMRIRGAKTELEEAGESTDGMAESTASLREEIMALSGVDIMLNENTFKSTYQIMDELSEKWGDLSDIAQATIIELVAGKHQGNVFSSLMANFDTARAALETSLSSSGSAMAEHEKWSKSLEARLNSLKASWQSLAQSFMNSDFLKFALDGIIALLDGLNSLIDSVGTVPTLLGAFTMFNSLFNNGGIFKVVEDQAAKSGKRITSAFQQAASQSAAALKSIGFKTNSAFKDSLKQDIAALGHFKMSVKGGMSEADAFDKHMKKASVSAKEYANSGKLAANGVEGFVKEQKSAQVSILAQNDSLSSANTIIKEYYGGCKNVSMGQKDFVEAVKKTNPKLAEQLIASRSATGAMFGYTSSLVGAKIASIGLTVAATALNAAITMGISALITWGISKLDDWIETSNELADRMDDVTSKYKEQHGELTRLKGSYDTSNEDSMISKYGKLSKGVDSLGKNISLTADEYSEYQSIVNTVADQIPSLVSGYDSQGNALLSCAGNVDTLAESYRNLIKEQDEAVLSEGESYFKDFKNNLESSTSYNATVEGAIGDLKELERLMSLSDSELESALRANTHLAQISDLLVDSGIKRNVFGSGEKGWETQYEHVYNAIKDSRNKVKSILDDASADINAYADNLGTVTEAYFSTAFLGGNDSDIGDYSHLSDRMQNVITQITSGFSTEFYADFLEEDNPYEALTKYYDSMLSAFDKLSESEKVELEAAFDLKTQFNSGEISYGEYVDGLQGVGELIDGIKGLDDNVRSQIKLSIGLNEDDVVEEYQTLLNRLTETSDKKIASGNIIGLNEQDAEKLLKSLSTEELSVMTKILPRIDANATVEEIQAAIDREMIIQGLTFDLNLEVEAAGIESLNTALAESVTATGLSSESISALKSRYAELESQGYDLSSMFEETSHGVHLNRQEFNKFESELSKQKLAKVDGDLKEMKATYDDLGEAIRNCDDDVEKARLFDERQSLAQKISEAATLAAQYKGLTSAYNDWLAAEEAGNERDMYENVIEGFATVKDELARGWADDGTVEFLELITGRTDLAGKSGKELKKIYDSLGKTIKYLGKDGKVLEDTGYSIQDFFTVDDEGNSTSLGVYRFLDAIGKIEEEAFGGKDVVKRDGKGNVIGFDFELAGGDEAIAEALGISEELVQIMVRAADDAGFVVSMDGTYKQLADLQNEAKAAADYLKEIGKTDFDFNFNTSSATDLTNQLEEAHKILKSPEFWNTDGTFNFSAKGATEAMQVVSTLQAKLDTVTQEQYGIGLTVEDDKYEDALSSLQDYGHTIAALNQLELNPKANAKEIEKLKKDLDTYAEELNNLPDDIKVEIGLVGEDGKTPLNDVESIKSKAQSGEIKIPTVLDIQANMDKNIEKLADLAWLNSGFLSESEETTIKKKYNIEVEGGDVDTSDVDNAVDNAVSDVTGTAGVASGVNGAIEVIKDVNVNSGEVSVDDSTKEKVKTGVEGRLNGMGVDVTTGVNVDVSEVDWSEVWDDIKNGWNNLVNGGDGESGVSTGSEGQLEYRIGLKPTVNEVDTSDVNKKTEEAVKSESGKKETVEKDVDIEFNVGDAIDDIAEFEELARKVSELEDNISATVTANIEGNVLGAEGNIENLKKFAEGAKELDGAKSNYVTVEANINGNITDKKNLENLKSFAEGAKALDGAESSYVTVGANIDGNITEKKNLDNLKALADGAEALGKVKNKDVSVKVSAEVDGNIDDVKNIDNLAELAEGIEKLDKLKNKDVNATVTANFEGNLKDGVNIESLAEFVAQAEALQDVKDSKVTVTANVDGTALESTEVKLNNLKVFAEGANALSDKNIKDKTVSVVANFDGTLLEADSSKIGDLELFAAGAGALKDVESKTVSVTANLDGTLASWSGNIEDLATFAAQAKALQSVKNSEVTVTANVEGNIDSNTVSTLERFASVVGTLPTNAVNVTVTANVDTATINSAITLLNEVSSSGLFKDYNATVKVGAEVVEVNDAIVQQYIASEKTAKGKVNWENNEELVNDFKSKVHEASGKVNWKNNTKDVKKSFSATGTVTWTSAEPKFKIVQLAKGTAYAGGSAFANGTSGRAFARGNWGVKGSGVALGGELGQELVVRDGKFFTIGDEGAEFFQYKKNDIIFNASQTEALFKYGGIKGADPRGKVFGGGTAFASGSTNIEGAAFSSGTGGGFWTNSVTGGTYGKPKDDDSFEETIDWIETVFEIFDRLIDKWDRKVNSVYASWSDRNTALGYEISRVGGLLQHQQSAYEEYMSAANAVGLEQKYVDLIKYGDIDISTIKDEALAEKIKDYQNWYNKAQECQVAIDELKEKEASLHAQRFELTQGKYENILQGFEHTEAMLNEYISQAEAQGHIVSKSYYDALISNEQDKIKNLQAQQRDLLADRQTYFNNMIADGYSEEDILNSEQWYEMSAGIDDVTQSIEESNTALIEFNNSMRDIDWEIFELGQSRISNITDEADFLIELMSNDKLYDDDGKLTNHGLATMGLHAQKYNTDMYQADDYYAQAQEIQRRMALDESDEDYLDPFDQNNIDKYNEYIGLYREHALAAEDSKEAIRDMVEEGIELELDAIQELIDKKNEELESAKDLYEYQKKVKEQTEEIASLEKQTAAYSNDDSEEAKAKVQELKVSLEEAKDELKETEWDKYISDTSAILDELYNEYELVLNARLDNIDYLLEQAIINANENTSTIKATLEEEVGDVGGTLSEAMSNIWNDGGSAKNALAVYGDDFKTKSTTTNTVLNGIKKSVDDMVTHLGVKADKKVGGNNTGSSYDKDPTKDVPKTKNPKDAVEPKVTDDTIKGIAAAIWIYGEDSGWGNNPFREDKLKNKIGASNAEKVQDYINKHGDNGDLFDFWIKNGRNLDKYKYNAFKSGAKNIDATQLAWTQEGKKQEFIVRPSDGAILTPVAKGDSILNAAASNNIWKMANSPTEFIKDNLSLGSSSIPNSTNTQNTYTQHLEKVEIVLPNVDNYDEFLAAMQKDKNFEKLIDSMTIGRLAGKSSLAKNKSIR